MLSEGDFCVVFPWDPWTYHHTLLTSFQPRATASKSTHNTWRMFSSVLNVSLITVPYCEWPQIYLHSVQLTLKVHFEQFSVSLDMRKHVQLLVKSSRGPHLQVFYESKQGLGLIFNSNSLEVCNHFCNLSCKETKSVTFVFGWTCQFHSFITQQQGPKV